LQTQIHVKYICLCDYPMHIRVCIRLLTEDL
jgi:hypothetical protein